MRLKHNNERRETPEPAAMAYSNCRAKTCSNGRPGTFVFDHCRYAGMVAIELLRRRRSILDGFPANLLGYYVALHDVGKVSPGFQGKYFFDLLERESPVWAHKSRNCGTETDHAKIGAKAVADLFGLRDEDPLVRSIARHHGRESNNGLGPNTDGNRWQEERKRLVADLDRAFESPAKTVSSADVDCDLLSGLTCVSDWLASDEHYFPADEASLSPEALKTRVDKALSDAGFQRTEFRPGLAFGEIFTDAFGNGYRIRNEQGALIEAIDRPGVYVMEASMGAGKTEAALYAAYRLISGGQNDGIYFALPTRLTSDRIYERVEKFLKAVSASRAQVRLSHGRAWLRGYKVGGDVGEGNRLPSWFAPAKRGLLYPFAVGTIDQVLFAVMNVKHSFVRLYGLAGKVVVLDEVHSYDMYTGTIVERLVANLRKIGCTVIILSATLTREKRRAILAAGDDREVADYPLVSAANDLGRCRYWAPEPDAKRKTIVLDRLYGSNAVVGRALEQARQGANVLCVANTVRKAQEWYRLLKSSMSENEVAEIGLLHSQFLPCRREKIERKWMLLLGNGKTCRPCGSILVSTQIVEQSVDIDADYMISEVAPIDMLLQRSGRLWRHERDVRPVARPVFALAFDEPLDLDSFTRDGLEKAIGIGSCIVYSPYILYRTLDILKERETLNVPDDMRSLVEGVYAERDESAREAIGELKEELKRKKEELISRATATRTGVALPLQCDSDVAPATRYGGAPHVNLLIVDSCDRGVGKGKAQIRLLDGTIVDVDGMKRDFHVIRRLYDNMVSVTVRNGLGRKSRDEAVLASLFHHSEMPHICRRADQGRLVLDCDGNETGLSYVDDFGVERFAPSPHGDPREAIRPTDEDFTEGVQW